MPANPNFIYAVIRNRRRFESLRTFTLESGREEIERRNQRRKEEGQHIESTDNLSRRSSVESIRSPSSSHQRAPTLSNVPEEEGAFAIGDDEDDDDDEDTRPTPAESTPEANSRAASISSNVDDAVPVQLRGMSEKARGKMPAGTPTFSRHNSTTSLGSYGGPGLSATGAFEPTTEWIESWLPELPLLTPLNLIQQLSPLLPRTTATDTIPANVLQMIQNTHINGIDPSAVRIHSFEWSPLSLGWYESLLWSFVFQSEMQVGKGTVGVWNSTGIKLFRVQETPVEGPTLTSPRGAVDAVGSNIVSRIGTLRANALASNEPVSPTNATGQGMRRSSGRSTGA